MAKKIFRRLRGTQDILPKDQANWSLVNDTFAKLCVDAGYKRIITPIIEDTNLFVRSVGSDSEIVSKEMYTFEDKSGNSLTLRPEGTAPIVRAYLENGLSSHPKPVKLYIVNEPMFRYNRPQAGRYRQFFQIGVEVFGSDNAQTDAQVIALAVRFYQRLNIKFELQINTIGDKYTRKKFKSALTKYFSEVRDKLDETAKMQLSTNPMRLLDSKDKKVIKVCEKAPQILDYLDRDSRNHFEAVLEYLDQLGIEYDLNPKLVRGLDYYNKTVFEFWGSHQGMQNSLGGGGRYDGLVEELGGKPTPAVGFSAGIERILIEIGKTGQRPAVTSPYVFVASLGDEAKKEAFALTEKLLDSGIAALSETNKKNIADQLSKAAKVKADYCLILGKKEILNQTIIVKDMVSGNQETVPIGKIVTTLATRYKSK
ncbi:MAG: histidine--tRNA ligase [bacterium]|nr:histidine--tRNA ligase [bacterium]